MDQMKTMKVGSREHPVVGYVTAKRIGTLPLVDIPMMSDYKWHLSCLNSRLEYPEMYRAAGEDVEAVIAELRKTLAGYDENGEALRSLARQCQKGTTA